MPTFAIDSVFKDDIAIMINAHLFAQIAMSSLTALREFTTKHQYRVPGSQGTRAWAKLEQSHKLQILNVLTEHYRAYQAAQGPDGSSFRSNLNRQLGHIKVKDWMLDADVATQASSPVSFPHWAKIHKLTQRQEQEYLAWMAKETTDKEAWEQELADKQGLYLYSHLFCMFFVLDIF